MIANHHQGGAKPRSVSIQMYAKIAGVVVLIAFVVGGFGEAYAPSQLIVAGNAAATTHNIVTHDLFFRLGFVGYLGESITDVALAFLLYVLLRPVCWLHRISVQKTGQEAAQRAALWPSTYWRERMEKGLRASSLTCFLERISEVASTVLLCLIWTFFNKDPTSF